MKIPSTFFQKILFLTAFLACAAPVFSQNKLVEKANEAYKLNQYAEAAALFEQALATPPSGGGGAGGSGKSAAPLKSKLAFCYRMNNKMDKAEPLYADLAQAEGASPDTWFYYGEALMSNGKYAEAKKWFVDYHRVKPEDQKGRLMAVACDKAPFIQPYFQHLEIQEFAHNSPADDNSAVAFRNGVAFSSDRPRGMKLMQEKSGWTGRDYLDIYFSEKAPGGGFGEPRQFSAKLSEVNKNSGNASFPADGSEVFFTRNDNVLNKQQTYTLQIYRAEAATGEGRWKNVEKLPFCTPAWNFMHPAASPDGQWLYFASNKAGGEGGTDLWAARRKDDGSWSNPENLGEKLNTSVNEGFPFADSEGRLYFCSKGHPGFGGFDIFVTERDAAGNWTTPLNLGKPVNSSLDDISIFVAPDRRSGMFTSSRSGGDDDIFLFSVLDEGIGAIGGIEVIGGETPTLAEAEKHLEVAAQENALPVFQEEDAPLAEVQEGQEEEAPEAFLEKSDPPAEAAGEESPEVFFEKSEPPAEAAEAVEEAVREESPEVFFEKSEPPAEPAESPAPLVIPEGNPTSDPEGDAATALPGFQDFLEKLESGSAALGDRFRLDGATYDPGVWQLTPRVSVLLDKLARAMRAHPSLELEIAAHTESLGIDEDNLRLSQNRADKAREYLLREGVPESRLSAKGFGETAPLNRCRNGVTCSLDEHQLNQRLEIRVLRF